MEKTFVINYSYPLRYQGTYIVKAEDSFAASRKLAQWLCDTYGGTDSASSIVMEVIDGQIKYI